MYSGKSHRAPFARSSNTSSSRSLQLVYTDVVGPLDPPSKGGSRYFITLIDDYSKWTVMFTMRKKSKSLKYFEKYHKYAETHVCQNLNKVHICSYSTASSLPHGLHDVFKLQTLRSDNGGEYLSNVFLSYLNELEIRNQLTSPHSPQQSRVSERMNRTLLNQTRSMLLCGNIDKSFWAKALSTAFHI